MNCILKALMAVVCVFCFASCSVVMAARKEGTSMEKVQACRTRGQYIACGAEIICSERTAEGALLETYRYQKERGSPARAFMHGVLDVSTCGIWEVVGTPMEACALEKAYFTIRVSYGADDIATHVELL